MKATILSGLVALALGAFTTSCSNILEENGVLNSAAQSGMGELRINLTTDASLNVSTKSGEEGEETNTNASSIANVLKGINTDDFSIQGTEETELSQKKSFQGTASTFKDGKKVSAATYTITAEKNFGTSGQKIGFGIPHFKGQLKNVNVPSNGKSENNTITVSLVNSVITVNKDNFNKLNTEGNAVITDLYVKDPEDPTNAEKNKILLSDKNTLKALTSLNDILFVSNEVTSVTMVIKGTIPGSTTPFSQETNIPINNEANKPKNYEVSYTISKDNGTLSLIISVDGSIKETQTISENIDPYPTTPAAE